MGVKRSISGVWRLGCGQVSEMERDCLVRSEQRDGGGGGEPRQGVLLALHSYKNGRLQARPRLFPTGSTFFSTGMRHEHLLQAQTYNLGLSGPLSRRIQRHWAFPHSPPLHRQRDTCTCIPFDTSPSQETYRLSRLRGGLRFSCCSALSQLKVGGYS